MKGEIELYNISFLILKVNLHFKTKRKRHAEKVKAYYCHIFNYLKSMNNV